MNKILIYWPYFQHYHLSRIRALEKLCVERKVRFKALALSSNSDDLHLTEKITVENGYIVFLDEYEAIKGEKNKSDVERLWQFLNSYSPDCILINGYAEPTARLLSYYALSRNIGAVVMSDSKYNDTPRFFYKEWFKKQLLSAYTSALVASSHASNYLAGLGIEQKYHFKPYDVVDNAFWSSCKELDAGREYILSVGRLVPKKNQGLLIEAYSKFKLKVGNDAPNLVLVGDGPEKARLQQMIMDRELNRCAKIVSYQKADELKKIYASAKWFVLASNEEEQWGLVVNEAVAAGIPVIVSKRIGCVPDLIEDMITGLTFDPVSVENLVSSLLKAHKEPELLKKMKAAAAERIQEFSCEHFAEAALLAAACASTQKKSKSLIARLVIRLTAWRDRSKKLTAN